MIFDEIKSGNINELRAQYLEHEEHLQQINQIDQITHKEDYNALINRLILKSHNFKHKISVNNDYGQERLDISRYKVVATHNLIKSLLEYTNKDLDNAKINFLPAFNNLRELVKNDIEYVKNAQQNDLVINSFTEGVERGTLFAQVYLNKFKNQIIEYTNNPSIVNQINEEIKGLRKNLYPFEKDIIYEEPRQYNIYNQKNKLNVFTPFEGPLEKYKKKIDSDIQRNKANNLKDILNEEKKKLDLYENTLKNNNLEESKKNIAFENFLKNNTYRDNLYTVTKLSNRPIYQQQESTFNQQKNLSMLDNFKGFQDSNQHIYQQQKSTFNQQKNLSMLDNFKVSQDSNQPIYQQQKSGSGMLSRRFKVPTSQQQKSTFNQKSNQDLIKKATQLIRKEPRPIDKPLGNPYIPGGANTILEKLFMEPVYDFYKSKHMLYEYKKLAINPNNIKSAEGILSKIFGNIIDDTQTKRIVTSTLINKDKDSFTNKKQLFNTLHKEVIKQKNNNLFNKNEPNSTDMKHLEFLKINFYQNKIKYLMKSNEVSEKNIDDIKHNLKNNLCFQDESDKNKPDYYSSKYTMIKQQVSKLGYWPLKELDPLKI